MISTSACVAVIAKQPEQRLSTVGRDSGCAKPVGCQGGQTNQPLAPAASPPRAPQLVLACTPTHPPRCIRAGGGPGGWQRGGSSRGWGRWSGAPPRGGWCRLPAAEGRKEERKKKGGESGKEGRTKGQPGCARLLLVGGPCSPLRARADEAGSGAAAAGARHQAPPTPHRHTEDRAWGPSPARAQQPPAVGIPSHQGSHKPGQPPPRQPHATRAAPQALSPPLLPGSRGRRGSGRQSRS